MFLGLFAHPPDTAPDVKHWWRNAFLSELVLSVGMTWFLGSIGMLYNAAKVSSVCEHLGDAVNEMTETQREPGEAALRMPTREQREQIEHLRDYIRGLNRGRGMGFVISRKRISHTFVVALVAKIGSLMAVSFPVIRSIARVEFQEGVLLNHTTGFVTP